jgi:glutamate decarboxylase
VYPGVGWIIWRDRAALPDELVFNVDYLGGQMPTFALNFSRPGAQVVAQYFNFLRLGRDGYTAVMQACRETADWLREEISAIGPYRCVFGGLGIPAIAFSVDADAGFSVYDVSDGLRSHGWLVPAYPMPEGMENLSVLRFVVRNGFSRDLACLLIRDVRVVTERLSARAAGATAPAASQEARTGFHH